MTVYFAQAGGLMGFIKIGTSKDVSRRISVIRCLQRETMWLLAVADGGMKEERAFHRRFGHLRQHGEWFWPGRDLLDFICTLPCPSEFVKWHGAYRRHAAFAQQQN